MKNKSEESRCKDWKVILKEKSNRKKKLERDKKDRRDNNFSNQRKLKRVVSNKY